MPQAVTVSLTNGLEKLAILTIPDDAEKESFALLDERLLNTPAVAVERARAATADMAELARVGVVQAMSLTHKWDDSLAQKVREEEEKVDKYEDALGTYLVKLSSPRTVSSSLDFAVTMMMGRRRRAGVLRSFFRMEKPSSPGSITSRMTSSGSAVRMACQKGSEVSAPSGSLP